MEERAHHVVVVAGEHGHTATVLPIPQPDRLIVGRRADPRVLVVKLHLFIGENGILNCTNSVNEN